MGAGAGCTIEISNSKVMSVADVSLQDATLETGDYSATLTLNCKVFINGTINMSSYYYGSGDVEEVAMTVDSVSLDLGFGNGYNRDILTVDATEHFETMFDGDIDSIWEDVLPILTVDDIDPEYVKDLLQKEAFFDGEGRFGGGWIGVTFEGDFEIDDVNSHNGYNPVGSFAAHITEGFVIDYLDKAKYGDNLEYTAYYNGDILDTYNTEKEAIAALKQEITEDIANADLSDCYVERTYYILTNGSTDRYEYETDFDSAEVVYTAESDFSDALLDTVEELDEEYNPNFDEGFDI